MLRSGGTLTRLAKAARPLRPYSSASTPRSASVLPSSSPTSPPSRPSAAPSSTPEAAEQLAQAEEELKPQPFILRPLSRRLQLKTLSSPSPSAASTTLHFLSPAAPNAPLALTLPNLFLRDSSIHSSHVHPASQQKLFRTTDIPLDGSLVGYGVHDVPGHGECLVTEWSTPLSTPGVPIQARKLSVVPVDFLAGILKDDAAHREATGVLPLEQPWDRAGLVARLKRTDYAAFAKDDGALLETLAALQRDGIVLLTGVPTQEREGHHTELRKVVERIGTLRSTWYGDLFDVKAVEGSKNIAYTNLDLGLHMDLTHFDSPPRYQFLHSLVNTHITGGLSYFVDTYAVASHMHQHSPSAFQTLCTEPVLFEYRNGPHHTRFSRPTFELKHGSSSALHAVNYSPPFQGPLPLSRLSRAAAHRGEVESDDSPRLGELHDALAQFAALCDGEAPPGSGADAAQREKWRWEHQLQPGECVVFDNRRVLHARTGFGFDAEKAKESGEESLRWLKGAYMDGDEVWSKVRVLRAEEKRRKEQEAGGGKRGRTLFV
ncbi:hypothetical protein JCM6882_007365 [Rhodosporidiobolus microsporus]